MTDLTKPEAPVEHLSVSAIKKYFTSPKKFYDVYVMKKPFVSSFTMETGKAWHKALESHYLGASDPLQIATTYFIENYSKLPEEEKDADAMAKALVALEKNFNDYITIKKEWVPLHLEISAKCGSPTENGLPLKGQIDVITTSRGILDHKYVKTRGGQAGEGEETSTFHYVQAWFYFYLYRELMKEDPLYFIIAEYKQTKNRDGSSQYKESMVLYEDPWMKKLDKWYDDFCINLRYQRRFLPNPFQSYGADDWAEYLNSPL